MNRIRSECGRLAGRSVRRIRGEYGMSVGDLMGEVCGGYEANMVLMWKALLGEVCDGYEANTV